jgi:hypothetical protein
VAGSTGTCVPVLILIVQQPPARQHGQQRERDGDDREVDRRADARPGETAADQCAGQTAEAVTRVERGHQRPSGTPLNQDGLGVHADVEHPAGQARREQRDHQRGQVRRQAQRDRDERPADPGDHRRAAAADSVHDPSRERDHDDQPGRAGQQGQAQDAVGQVQVLLDGRDPRQPDPVADSEHGKIGHHCDPRATEPLRWAAAG